MPGLGIDLTSWNNQKIVTVGEVVYLLGGPERIVVGEAYGVQSQILGPLNQFINTHETVIRVGIAVSVKVYQQELFIQPGYWYSMS